MNPDLSLKYPGFNYRLRKEKGQTYIFDEIRKKWLLLTPEEWVRQHVVNYLVVEKNFHRSNIAVEKELTLNDLKRRYDLVVYTSDLKPYLIVECKAPYVELDQFVIDQALRYNLVVKAPYVMITNGIRDFVYNSENKLCELLPFTL
ncbi:MAG: type I restriction enzyme HsdR N-terminal domain-containing protein [Bacteroidia bacterium]|nr:type I restriction enzyme HsdR N-terminal domain-containing protein [Bacteroidia bacterium]